MNKHFFDDVILIRRSHFKSEDFYEDKNWGNRKAIEIDSNIRFDCEYKHKESLFDSIESIGKNVNVPSVVTTLYSIAREGSNENEDFNFDIDNALYEICVLSQLIYPGYIDFHYSGRIYFEDCERTAIKRIIPGYRYGASSEFKAVGASKDRSYLLPENVDELRDLWKYFKLKKIEERPLRIEHAMHWFVISQNQNYFNPILISIVTALEILLVTNESLIKKQFSERINQITLLYDEFAEVISKKDASKIYDLRSMMVHSTASPKDSKENNGWNKITLSAQNFLRTVLKKAIIDDEFAMIFNAPNSIKDKWPVVL